MPKDRTLHASVEEKSLDLVFELSLAASAADPVHSPKEITDFAQSLVKSISPVTQLLPAVLWPIVERVFTRDRTNYVDDTVFTAFSKHSPMLLNVCVAVGDIVGSDAQAACRRASHNLMWQLKDMGEQVFSKFEKDKRFSDPPASCSCSFPGCRSRLHSVCCHRVYMRLSCRLLTSSSRLACLPRTIQFVSQSSKST
ncbi:hypothetical protein BCR44DRAFT_61829 [Catenaria anguillulae PL171]|uniref:Uncharacterized protein n=1 Tax=Catenaria anguillulae PL171 TaxID=765915 RepID=A0A1Y2H9D4_9FUNG|nr:hypothetical protein BCR44DRAFT_61829 [Catenaria anguillulae PL171]